MITNQYNMKYIAGLMTILLLLSNNSSNAQFNGGIGRGDATSGIANFCLSPPTISITGNATACGSVTLTASGGSTYLWSGGSTPGAATNTFTVSGNYTVTATAANGCTALQTVSVTVHPLPTFPSITGFPATAICLGNSASLSANAFVPPTGGSNNIGYLSGTSPGGGAMNNNLFMTRINTTTTYLVNGLIYDSPFSNGLVRMVLYTNNGSSPGIPIAETAPAGSVPGLNTYPLITPVVIPPGNYWVGVVFQVINSSMKSVSMTGGLIASRSQNFSQPFTSGTFGINGGIVRGFGMNVTSVTQPSYSWSPSSGLSSTTTQTVTANPSTTTLYTVTATSAQGCTANQTYNMEVNPLPVISISGSTTACDSVVLTASGGVSYLWSGGSTPTAATNKFTTSGNYNVTVTSSNGCTATQSVSVTVNNSPVIGIVGNTTACSSVTLTASGGSTYSWSGGSTPGAATNTFTVSGNYTVTTTAANGCTASQTVNVTVHPLPTFPSITGFPATAICLGNSASLSANAFVPPTGGSNNIGYLSGTSPGGGAMNNNLFMTRINTTTTYLVNGLIYDSPFSNGLVRMVLYTNNGSSPGIPIAETAPAGSVPGLNTYPLITPVVIPPGNYWVGVVFQVINSSMKSVSMTGGLIASRSQNFSQPFTSGTFGINGGIVRGFGMNVTSVTQPSYSWSPSSGLSSTTTQTVTANPSTTTLYTVTATSAQGCTANQTYNMEVNPLPVISISGSTTACDSVVLTASGGVSYLWSGGSTPTAATNKFTTSGNYNVTVTSSNGCTATQSVSVTVNNSPVIGIVGNTTACSSVTLTASGGSTYSWSGGSSPNSAFNTFANSGNYTLTVNSIAGCSSTQLVGVTVVAVPSVNLTGSYETCENGSVTINPSDVILLNANSFNWSIIPPTGSFGGSGNLINANQIDATYQADADDAGKTVRLLITAINPGCPNATAQQNIFIRPQPTVTPIQTSSAYSLCDVNPFVQMNVVSPEINTDYEWSPSTGLYLDASFTIPYSGGNANTVYAVPFLSTVYSVQATNTTDGCTTGPTTRAITICPNQTAAICQADATASLTPTTTPTFNNYSILGAAVPGLAEQVSAIVPNDLGRTIWRRVTVPANGEVAVTTLPGTNATAALNINSSIVHIFRLAPLPSPQNCSGSLILVASNADGGAGDMSYAHATGLTPGSIVYVRISGRASALNSGTANFFRMAVTPGLIWTGAANNDFSNPANWHGGDATSLNVPNASRSVIIPCNITTVPQLTTNSDARWVSFTAATTNSVGINLNGFTLNTAGNWSVLPATGIINLDVNSGIVNFNGIIAQTISGRVRFDNLTLNNNSGLSLNAVTRVHGVLHTITGTLTTNDNLTLHSTITKTAVVNPGAGSITGNVNVERRLGASFASTAHLSAPVSGAVMNSTISGYRDDYSFPSDPTTVNYGPGVPGFFYSPVPIGFTSATNFPKIWEWVEDHYAIGNSAGLLQVPQGNTGVFSNITGWKSAVINNLVVGKGFSHTNIPNNITVDTYGPLNNGSLSIGATYSAAPAPFDVTQGWNLVGNPYASPISWELMRSGANNPGLQTTYYIYKSSGTGAGNYGTYTVGGLQTNSTTENIPSSHGFIVIANGAPTTVNFLNSYRTFNPLTSGNNFAASPTSNSMRLQLRGGQGDDETLIRFGSFETAFNGLEDAHKLMAYAPGVPSVYTIAGTQRSALNSLPQLTQDYIIPLGVYAQVAGTYELEMTEMVDINPTVMIYLEDLATGTLQNIRENAIYIADIATTGNIDDRFRLIVRPAVSLNGIAATCNGNGNDGKVEVHYPSSAAVNIELKNTLGAVVSTAQNVTGLHTFNSLPSGNYMAEITHNCGFVSVDYVSVAAGNGVAATLVASTNTVNLESNLPVTFTATAQNATSFNWNFGDGTVINNGPANVSHTYSAAGNYIVTFTANNAECSAVASAEVSVVSPTGIFDANYEGVRIFGVRNRVNVQFNNLDDKQGRIEILNLLGQNIRTVEVNTTKGTREIEVPGMAVGQYLVRVTANERVYTQKVYLSK
jgi:hypothetical protein